MSIANYFTLLRIFISPIFLMAYLSYSSSHTNLLLISFLLILLIISELSDACDGYLARKYNQVTDLGKILDPMADSIYRISIFLTFTLPPVNLPMILIFIFVYRDSMISTLRTICALNGFALAARMSGKLKAIIQAIAAFIVVLLLIPYTLGYLSLEALQLTSAITVGIAGLYTLFSGFEYLYANRQSLSYYFSRGLIQQPQHHEQTLG